MGVGVATERLLVRRLHPDARLPDRAYAGDAGLDVVNMSFYVDPWLYNCTSNPADSPEDQLEQRTIIEAVSRALDYAYRKGVTLVSALGNEATDLGHPTTDATSPDYGGEPYTRTIDNATCLSMPTEGPHVIGVSALGASGRKAYYSNWGTEQISVAAPGGDYYDPAATGSVRDPGNLILSTYPKNVAIAEGDVDPETGDVTPQGIVVRTGLSGNERVVLRAGGFLNPGDAVHPVLAPAGGK